jgi:hypothetical protein
MFTDASKAEMQLSGVLKLRPCAREKPISRLPGPEVAMNVSLDVGFRRVGISTSGRRGEEVKQEELWGFGRICRRTDLPLLHAVGDRSRPSRPVLCVLTSVAHGRDEVHRVPNTLQA